jgi:MarR family transcriptional regulator, organic hydroperoxide resistance regulator
MSTYLLIDRTIVPRPPLDRGPEQADTTEIMKDIDTSESLSVGLSNRIAFRLYQCSNLLNKTGTRALDRHQVTTQQWAILGALVRERWKDGIAVGDLAALVMVSRQNLTGVLSRMEARELIERTVDPNDNRSRLIKLTAEGRQRWKDMQGEIAVFYEDVFQGMSSSDKIHALHYLSLLRDNFKGIDMRQGGED